MLARHRLMKYGYFAATSSKPSSNNQSIGGGREMSIGWKIIENKMSASWRNRRNRNASWRRPSKYFEMKIFRPAGWKWNHRRKCLRNRKCWKINQIIEIRRNLIDNRRHRRNQKRREIERKMKSSMAPHTASAWKSIIIREREIGIESNEATSSNLPWKRNEGAEMSWRKWKRNRIEIITAISSGNPHHRKIFERNRPSFLKYFGHTSRSLHRTSMFENREIDISAIGGNQSWNNREIDISAITKK